MLNILDNGPVLPRKRMRDSLHKIGIVLQPAFNNQSRLAMMIQTHDLTHIVCVLNAVFACTVQRRAQVLLRARGPCLTASMLQGIWLVGASCPLPPSLARGHRWPRVVVECDCVWFMRWGHTMTLVLRCLGIKRTHVNETNIKSCPGQQKLQNGEQ